jgi:hypothetical protein
LDGGKIALVGTAGALLLSGVAMAATPQFYRGNTGQQQPILVYTKDGKVFLVTFDAECRGAKKCQTLDGAPKLSTALAFTYGEPQLPIKDGKFKGKMKTDRHNFIDIHGTVTPALVTGSFTATSTFEMVVKGRLKAVGPVCHTGTVTYTVTREMGDRAAHLRQRQPLGRQPAVLARARPSNPAGVASRRREPGKWALRDQSV